VKQARLPLAPRAPRKSREIVTSHEQANAESAAVILADPARYDGLMVEWAKKVQEAKASC
jgi:hypothetical protein